MTPRTFTFCQQSLREEELEGIAGVIINKEEVEAKIYHLTYQ